MEGGCGGPGADLTTPCPVRFDRLSALLERRLSAAREPAPIQPETDLTSPSSGHS